MLSTLSGSRLDPSALGVSTTTVGLAVGGSHLAGLSSSAEWSQARGGCPTKRLNTVVKCACVWNPTRSATSVIDILVLANISRARSTRRRSKYS